MSHDADCAGCAECRDPNPEPRRGSGSPSEAYYASRGYVRLQLRLPADSVNELGRLSDKLSELCERDVSRAEALDAIIRCAPEDRELATLILERDQGSDR